MDIAWKKPWSLEGDSLRTEKIASVTTWSTSELEKQDKDAHHQKKKSNEKITPSHVTSLLVEQNETTL